MEQPPSVAMGSPFLPAQGSPSLRPGLSIHISLTARRYLGLGQSCHQPSCNRGHHQHSAVTWPLHC